MKISLNWLCEYVDLRSIDPKEIAERLTLATAEVETVEEVQNSVESAMVGEIVRVEPLEAAHDTLLSRAEVNCGTRLYITTCGAPNIRAGMKAAFAPAGAALSSGDLVLAKEILGAQSEGVLCSPMELGLGRFHESLLECPRDAAPGSPLAQWIRTRDVLFEIDNKSITHRPDLWGHYGFARELAAIFALELRALDTADLSRFDDLPPFPVRVDDPDNCPCYSCLAFDVECNPPSPLWMQARLLTLGQRTYGAVVDATNYALLEIGQPTHAFDRTQFAAIRVAPIGRDALFETLDKQTRRLQPDDVMIWNESAPVALAGIMGGLNTQVETSTNRVLLESANFKGSRVRRTSTRLGLRTEASQRFEKNQPPANTKLAVARIFRILQLANAGPEARSCFTVVGDLKEESRRLLIPADYISRQAGAELPQNQVVSILGSLGFGAKYENGQMEIAVPPYRSEQDISIPADILEEVMRVYGYGGIEPSLPTALVTPVPINKPLRRQHKARRILAEAHSFHEVQTYAWYDDNWLAKIGFYPESALTLRNPIAEGKARLRTSMIPNLLALIAEDAAHRDQLRFFEIGSVFIPGANGHKESIRVSGVSYLASPVDDSGDHFRGIKGAVEDLFRMVAAEPVRVETGTTNPSDPPWNQGEWRRLLCGDRMAGEMGLLTGRAKQAVAPHGQVVWFELTPEVLEGPLYPELKYEPVPTFPGSWQDFSLVWSLDDGYAKLEKTLDGFDHPLIRRRDFLFLYKGKGVEPNKASYTFRFWLGDAKRTLSEADLLGFRSAFLGYLAEKGIELR